jgi:glycosidase
MTELSPKIGRNATLDDIPDEELDKLEKAGFEWVWLLSVWQLGEVGRKISRESPVWLKEFNETLPDLKEEDIQGSGFAITKYQVQDQLGGDVALSRLRKRLQDRGLKLMLDFVPNHMAIDHEWAETHPDYFIQGNETLLSKEPANYIKLQTKTGELILAHGRDPYYPGWSDTLQLNYANPELQKGMIEVLTKIAEQCDGVRCDMAMLVPPEIFEKTWGLTCQPFWPEAIKRTKKVKPDFLFMAEVYWDYEWKLQQLGFDYTYDKRLYDRLREVHAKPVREHFLADMDFQKKLTRFLENHDEPRAAAVFPDDIHEAAAIITFTSIGMRFFHQGQLEGKKKRISPHLVRGPVEPVNERLKLFYDKLLSILRQSIVRNGTWNLVESTPAWNGNGTNDCYISFAWEWNNEKMLIVVNYAPNQSQCYLKFPFNDLANKQWKLKDLFSGVIYERNGNELESKGLYLDEEPWKYYVFEVGSGIN